MTNKVIAASGGFDPLHVGHIEYLKKAKKLGGELIVILNKDKFLERKKGFVFMPYEQRKIILQSLWFVDGVVGCVDDDQTVCQTLRVLEPDIFAKGGDRFSTEIPEAKVCKELGIKIVDGLGAKIQSSSELVKNAKK